MPLLLKQKVNNLMRHEMSPFPIPCRLTRTPEGSRGCAVLTHR